MTGAVSATAAAIRRILGDSALASRMGKAGRQRVVEQYQLDATVTTYLRLYQRFFNLHLIREGHDDRDHGRGGREGSGHGNDELESANYAGLLRNKDAG